jgi:lactoylglutathione lyase
MTHETVSLRLIVLRTPHLKGLKAFYQALGINLVEEQHGKGPAHHAGKLGETVLELYPLAADDAVADKTTRLGFAVGNLDDVLNGVRTLGVTVITSPQQTPWGLRAVVHDPDGRAVELYQAFPDSVLEYKPSVESR